MRNTLTALKKHAHIFILLAAAIGIRIYIFATMHPVIHTDSITFLFLGEIDIVRTPGYPLFIEILLSANDLLGLTTDYFQLICFGQIFILGVLNALLIYHIARFLTKSRGFALFVGLAYNLNYFVVGFEFQIMTETLSITLLLAVILLYLSLFKGNKLLAFLGGILTVLLILTRPTYLLLGLGFVILTLLCYLPRFRTKPFRRAYAPGLAIFLIVGLLGAGGWMVRNQLKYGYFGISTLMPYQLRYYTNALFEKYRPSGNAEMDYVAQVYAEELKKTGRSSVTVHNFHERLRKERGLSDIDITRLFLRVNLKLIKDYPGEYVRQVLESLLSYYRQYSPQWTAGNTAKFLDNQNLLQNLFRWFFQLYRALFIHPALLAATMIAAPAVVLIFTHKQREALHTWMILMGAIHYTCFISVLSTHAGINNLRYRQPVESLILLMFYAALFFLGKGILKLWGKRTSPLE